MALKYNRSVMLSLSLLGVSRFKHIVNNKEWNSRGKELNCKKTTLKVAKWRRSIHA